MLLRSMSADCQSLASRPLVALASVPAAASREPVALLVRAPRGLKFHPRCGSLGAPIGERAYTLRRSTVNSSSLLRATCDVVRYLHATPAIQAVSSPLNRPIKPGARSGRDRSRGPGP
jgi:hypothetical protein